MVGAYAATRVTSWFSSGSTIVISLGLKPTGAAIVPARDVFIAKPTPAWRGLPTGLPIQKKVYPAPSSTSVLLSENLVSLRAAMSIRLFANSRAMMAVLRSGSALLSSSVLTFQQAIRSPCCCFCFVLRPYCWIASRPRYGGRLEWSQLFLGLLFSPPLHMKKAVLSLNRAALSLGQDT